MIDFHYAKQYQKTQISHSGKNASYWSHLPDIEYNLISHAVVFHAKGSPYASRYDACLRRGSHFT